jgi:protease I
MITDRKLENRRIAVLAADGFEKVELVVPMRAYELAGATVDVISLRHGRIRGVNLHEPASRIRVTKTVEEAKPNDYDGLLVPGGFINPDLLRQSEEAREFVRAFDRARKPIATLCHGPWVLASAGILKGRTMTSWPGVRDDLVNAGATSMKRSFETVIS